MGLLSLASFSSIHAQTISWGSSVSTTPVSYTSALTAGNSQLIWTIGYFGNGFTPSSSNYSNWANNYTEVDRVSEVSFEVGSVSAWAASGQKDDVGADAVGKQAYIFVYNNLDLLGAADGEALLVRENGFLFPDIPNQDTFDIADNKGSTKDDSFDVIWGQVDRDREALGGLVSGGGVYSNRLADTETRTWEIQTATWAAVPEPSTALLGVLSAFALLRRRRN